MRSNLKGSRRRGLTRNFSGEILDTAPDEKTQAALKSRYPPCKRPTKKRTPSDWGAPRQREEAPGWLEGSGVYKEGRQLKRTHKTDHAREVRGPPTFLHTGRHGTNSTVLTWKSQGPSQSHRGGGVLDLLPKLTWELKTFNPAVDWIFPYEGRRGLREEKVQRTINITGANGAFHPSLRRFERGKVGSGRWGPGTQRPSSGGEGGGGSLEGREGGGGH